MLGKNILKARKKLGMSQEELSEKVGVTRQTISNWELKETQPNPDQLKLLSEALNVSIDELLGNDIKDILVTKVDQTQKKTNTVYKLLIVTSVIFLLIFLVEVVAITFYSLGYKKIKETSTLYVSCNLNGQKYYYDVSYYTNDLIVLQTGGSGYIFDNVINRKDYIGYSVVNIISDINNYFVSLGGGCK